MLLLFVAANFALAGVGSRLGDRGHGSEVWYASLRKPRAHFPAWVEGPGWALIAIATGVAGWLIWLEPLGYWAETALVLYGFQLIINAVWQGISIGLRHLGQGLAVGVLLWGVITLTAVAAAIAGGAGWCWLIPYWAWVGYGVYLNHGLWRLNQPAAAAPPPAPPASAA